MEYFSQVLGPVSIDWFIKPNIDTVTCAVFHLGFEFFRTIASFIKISSWHSLINKLIFSLLFLTSSGQFEKYVGKCPEIGA